MSLKTMAGPMKAMTSPAQCMGTKKKRVLGSVDHQSLTGLGIDDLSVGSRFKGKANQPAERIPPRSRPRPMAHGWEEIKLTPVLSIEKQLDDQQGGEGDHRYQKAKSRPNKRRWMRGASAL